MFCPSYNNSHCAKFFLKKTKTKHLIGTVLTLKKKRNKVDLSSNENSIFQQMLNLSTIREIQKKTQHLEVIKINPNCVLFRWQSSGRSVSSSRSPLRRSQETRPGKRISDFRQKSRRAFRLKRLKDGAP